MNSVLTGRKRLLYNIPIFRKCGLEILIYHRRRRDGHENTSIAGFG